MRSRHARWKCAFTSSNTFFVCTHTGASIAVLPAPATESRCIRAESNPVRYRYKHTCH
jgi:hypothetical protein